MTDARLIDGKAFAENLRKKINDKGRFINDSWTIDQSLITHFRVFVVMG